MAFIPLILSNPKTSWQRTWHGLHEGFKPQALTLPSAPRDEARM